MKKILAKFMRKRTLSYNDGGITVDISGENVFKINWQSILKLVFVEYFEEYSGYFLTEDYKSKSLYQNIYVDCNRNVVKIRTGGTPTVKNNTSKPFSRKFGTTSIAHVVFVEFKDDKGLKNLYAVHYQPEKLGETVSEIKACLDDEKIYTEGTIEGFSYIADL
ncbi:hypothetical protein ACXGQW_05240 [Wenyingzhuangia sp. IMCC45533]